MATENKTLFAAADGVANGYRIPSIVMTKSGRLVAVADARKFTVSDNPNRIDKVIRTSDDGGKSWSEERVIVKEFGDSKNNSSAAIDPSLLYNRFTDEIFMIYCHTPAGVGLLNSAKGTGYDKNGRKILINDKKRYFIEDGKIFKIGGSATEYVVDGEGNIIFNGRICGNYKLKDSFREFPTSYLMISKSSDGGQSWSVPRCLNFDLKNPNWCFIGAGPANGITLENGKYKGRMVFPIYYSSHKKAAACNACMIFSDDDGKSWQIGDAVKRDLRENNLNLFAFLYSRWITESQVVEVGDGLKVFARNHNRCRRIAVADSKDGGKSWQNYRYVDEIIHPICQITAIAFDYKGKRVIATVNAADIAKRCNGVLRLSTDGGDSFPYSYKIKDGEFVYSSAAYMGEGKIALLYEGETAHTKIDFTIIDIENILND